jgi:hypothetical protein
MLLVAALCCIITVRFAIRRPNVLTHNARVAVRVPDSAVPRTATIDLSIMAEFLASHGYVVAAARTARLTGVRCHGVDCGVDSPHLPAALAPKPAGQITRIVYVIRDITGLECDTLSV